MIQDAIHGVAELVDRALEKMKPQKVVVEFGIELGYEGGKLTSLILHGSTKGTLKISLEWVPGRLSSKQ